MHGTPLILEDYLNYMETIKGTSHNTAKEYFFDLRTFFRFIKLRYKLVDDSIPFEDIDIEDVDIELIKKSTYRIYTLSYLTLIKIEIMEILLSLEKSQV